MARSIVAIAGEGRPQRMLLVKDRCFRCSVGRCQQLPGGKERFATYPRNGYNRYQIIEAGWSVTWPASRIEAVPRGIAWSCQ